MTGDMMNQLALVEKTPKADLLRDMIGFAAERLIEKGDGRGHRHRSARPSVEAMHPSASTTTLPGQW
ncbi:hypothetical protein [Mesorhizobium sp. Cs1299R1N3]|uniref:hypothetical protein n=1 Tax=Mesorhizobium sp. Cs1299R1N3 TaxID=3015173 RepID=UPI00301CCF04